MATNGAEKVERGTVAARAKKARVLSHGEVKTGRDFAGLMSALMSDLIDGRVDHKTATAVCRAGANLLKIVEMEHKFGKQQRQSEHALTLAP